MLRLTLLAPDMVEMILDGRQPPELQFQALRKSPPRRDQRMRCSGAHRSEVRDEPQLRFVPCASEPAPGTGSIQNDSGPPPRTCRRFRGRLKLR
jgi:hypothetical protein